MSQTVCPYTKAKELLEKFVDLGRTDIWWRIFIFFFFFLRNMSISTCRQRQYQLLSVLEGGQRERWRIKGNGSPSEDYSWWSTETDSQYFINWLIVLEIFVKNSSPINIKKFTTMHSDEDHFLCLSLFSSSFLCAHNSSRWYHN